ncbi:MAG: sigma-70 family RNA polymerase sigma factor [Acidimicrobiales bacterium]|nr:sigma-70 family RNA polymerase sigma factor [Acidimicrobiales bacterium]
MAVDRAAEEFAQHYLEEVSRCVGLAYVLCGDEGTAEEVVADAFAACWPHFRAGKVDDVHAYLRRAVVNTMNSRLRRRRHERAHLEGLRAASGAAAGGSGAGSGSGEAVAADRSELWPALLTLPMDQRTVLALRFLEDRSEAETAAVLGVKVGTVKSRTSRALSQLRAALGEEPTDV